MPAVTVTRRCHAESSWAASSAGSPPAAAAVAIVSAMAVPERGKAGAAALSHLAAQQVQALDPVGALVDRIEPVVPVVLLDVVLAGVAVATEHLDRQVVGFQAPLRGPTLGDRGQDVEQQRRRVGFLVGFGAVLQVDELGAVERQRERPFDIGLLRQQHSPDVGVLDDRHLRRRRILGGHRPALRTLARVLQRFEIAGVAQRNRLPFPRRAGPRSSCGTCR